MRAGILAFTLAMVVAACGASETSSDGSPAVEITSIELDGPTAAIGFEVTAEGELPTTQVNWGDDTLSPEIRGEGSLNEIHTYADGVGEATIVVTVIDEEGSVASAARSISLATTSTVPGTDSVPDATTTSSTVAPTTTEPVPTTSVAPTTTAPAVTTPAPPDTPAPSPPPTDAPTTTLPPPPPEDLVIELDPGAATFSGTNDGSATRAERIGPSTIGVYTDAGGNGTKRTSTATLTWTVPAADLTRFGTTANVSVLLEPAVTMTLHSDDADGNAAGFDMKVHAIMGGTEVGSGVSTARSIGAGDDLSLSNTSEQMGFGATVEIDGPLTIEWTITCRASGADSLFLPFSISECDALDDSRGVSLGTARLTVKAP